MRRAQRRWALVLLASVTAGGVIAGTTGCTGTPAPDRTAASSTPRPGTTSAARLQKWLKSGGTMPKLTPVAHAQGTIANDMTNKTVAVKAEVISVTRTDTTTELVWRLSTADGSSVDLGSSQLSQVPWSDTRLVGLEVTSTKTTYHPYTMVPPQTANGSASECVCSDLRMLGLDGSGRLLYASMPRLPKDVATVTVTIPGFPGMPDVPVRNGPR